MKDHDHDHPLARLLAEHPDLARQRSTRDHRATLLHYVSANGVEDFRREDVTLPAFRAESWIGLVFAHLAPKAPSLAEALGALGPRLEGKGLASMRLAFRRDWTLDCNWKVYVDNYLEGYHIPIVHPGLMKEIDYPRYRTETFRYHSQQLGPVKEVRPGDVHERVYKPGEGLPEALYFWVFPNLMLNIYPDNIQTNVIAPISHDKTLAIFEWFFHDAQSEQVKERAKKAIGFSETVQQEDMHICEAVQRGLQSATYDRGRYSVKRENGVHHFHLLLSEFLGGESAVSSR